MVGGTVLGFCPDTTPEGAQEPYGELIASGGLWTPPMSVFLCVLSCAGWVLLQAPDLTIVLLTPLKCGSLSLACPSCEHWAFHLLGGTAACPSQPYHTSGILTARCVLSLGLAHDLLVLPVL